MAARSQAARLALQHAVLPPVLPGVLRQRRDPPNTAVGSPLHGRQRRDLFRTCAG